MAYSAKELATIRITRRVLRIVLNASLSLGAASAVGLVLIPMPEELT